MALKRNKGREKGNPPGESTRAYDPFAWQDDVPQREDAGAFEELLPESPPDHGPIPTNEASLWKAFRRADPSGALAADNRAQDLSVVPVLASLLEKGGRVLHSMARGAAMD